MTEQQVIVVKTEKSAGIAYILLIFLGQLGIHRFYLGKTGSAIAQLLLGIIGWATVWIVIGFVPLGILWIWMAVDLFLVPGMVREANSQIQSGKAV